MKKTKFGKNQWNPEDFIQAYTFRYIETPDFHQGEDCIFSDKNPDHPEGFDNISLLTKETYRAGAEAEIHCSFEALGCPEIILVEKLELCEDGATRYGACFEVVLYKDGFNVWRHYREDGRCFWHRRLGVEYPVAENVTHSLTVKVEEQELIITMDGQKTTLRTEDLPKEFHLGITVCEGIARVYDWEIR